MGPTGFFTRNLTAEVMTMEYGDPIDDSSLDDLFRALQNPIRRRLLCALLDHHPEDTFRVPEDVPPGEEDPERLAILLVHQHLPMLETAGLIHWDRETNEIQMSGEFTQVRNILMVIKEEQTVGRATGIA